MVNSVTNIQKWSTTSSHQHHCSQSLNDVFHHTVVVWKVTIKKFSKNTATYTVLHVSVPLKKMFLYDVYIFEETLEYFFHCERILCLELYNSFYCVILYSGVFVFYSDLNRSDSAPNSRWVFLYLYFPNQNHDSTKTDLMLIRKQKIKKGVILKIEIFKSRLTYYRINCLIIPDGD